MVNGTPKSINSYNVLYTQSESDPCNVSANTLIGTIKFEISQLGVDFNKVNIENGLNVKNYYTFQLPLSGGSTPNFYDISNQNCSCITKLSPETVFLVNDNNNYAHLIDLREYSYDSRTKKGTLKITIFSPGPGNTYDPGICL